MYTPRVSKTFPEQYVQRTGGNVATRNFARIYRAPADFSE